MDLDELLTRSRELRARTAAVCLRSQQIREESAELVLELTVLTECLVRLVRERAYPAPVIIGRRARPAIQPEQLLG